MIESKLIPVCAQESRVLAKVCDRCLKRVTNDDIFEFQEFLHIKLMGGYGSVWGDGNVVEADLCQRCTHSILKDFARIVGE